VVVEGDIYERSYEYALNLADEERLEFVHPFNDETVIAGQGTVGLELIEQCPDLDTVLVSIGGGGLISGIGTVLKEYDPSICVVGVQPEGAAHAKPSLEGDEIHELSDVDTVAEGIADTRLLPKTFSVVRERVDDVVSVSDREISVAVALLAERAKTVAEAAGATPLAALLTGAVDAEEETVAVVVSGGNANLTDHAELCQRGLSALGRYAQIRLEVSGWPTVLGSVTETVADHGAEVDRLERVSSNPGDDPNRDPVVLALEGSGPDHLASVIGALDGLEAVDVTTVPKPVRVDGCSPVSADTADDGDGPGINGLTASDG
jgi:threonine dehydratase